MATSQKNQTGALLDTSLPDDGSLAPPLTPRVVYFVLLSHIPTLPLQILKRPPPPTSLARSGTINHTSPSMFALRKYPHFFLKYGTPPRLSSKI